MKMRSKTILLLLACSLTNNLLFAQAAVEDRSISLDSDPRSTANSINAINPINPHQPVSSFQEFDTPIQNPSEVPNLVTQPVYDPAANQPPRSGRAQVKTQLPTADVSFTQDSSLNEEIRILEQEIEADNSFFQQPKKKTMDLQSLSSEARLQRLENIYEQQQKLKFEKKIRLLQLQMQALNGVIEAQQHKLQQYQSQEKVARESLERRVAELSNKAVSQSSVSELVASSPKIATPAKGFESPGKTAAVVQPKAPEAKKSYTLKDSEAEQQALYNAAYEQIKGRKYNQAIEKLNQYIVKYPQGQFTEGANYWLGEIYMLQSKYDKALTAFDQVVTKYPKGQKSADALYKKGLVYLYKKDFNQAKAILSNVIKKYANTEAAGLAAKQLKTIESINNAA